jgi:transketolase
MRKAFAEGLAALAEKNNRIVLLTADLGFMALEPFASKFPQRFINVGVAEQNMVGVATGLAEAGFIPFVYSISNFAAMRPFEFIRNGPVAHRLPVRIVSVGGGLEYSHNGISHFGLEDVGILRTQSGLRIVVPCDVAQARSALEHVWNLSGPVYLRLSKNESLDVPELCGRFSLDHAEVILDGTDVQILAFGTTAALAVDAAKRLKNQGVSAAVVVVSSLNPGPHSDIVKRIQKVARNITVEAHYTTGGFGSWVAEVAAEHVPECRILRCGVDGEVGCRTGGAAWTAQRHNLTPEALAVAATDLMART